MAVPKVMIFKLWVIATSVVLLLPSLVIYLALLAFRIQDAKLLSSSWDPQSNYFFLFAGIGLLALVWLITSALSPSFGRKIPIIVSCGLTFGSLYSIFTIYTAWKSAPAAVGSAFFCFFQTPQEFFLVFFVMLAPVVLELFLLFALFKTRKYDL